MVRNVISLYDYDFSVAFDSAQLNHSSFFHCCSLLPTFQTDPLHTNTSHGTTGMPWALVHPDVSCCINVLTVRSGAYGSLETSKLSHLAMLQELHIDAVEYAHKYNS